MRTCYSRSKVREWEGEEILYLYDTSFRSDRHREVPDWPQTPSFEVMVIPNSFVGFPWAPFRSTESNLCNNLTIKYAASVSAYCCPMRLVSNSAFFLRPQEDG